MVFPVQSSDSDLTGSKNATADETVPKLEKVPAKVNNKKETLAGPLCGGISSGEHFVDVGNRARGSDKKQQHKSGPCCRQARYSNHFKFMGYPQISFLISPFPSRSSGSSLLDLREESCLLPVSPFPQQTARTWTFRGKDEVRVIQSCRPDSEFLVSTDARQPNLQETVTLIKRNENNEIDGADPAPVKRHGKLIE